MLGVCVCVCVFTFTRVLIVAVVASLRLVLVAQHPFYKSERFRSPTLTPLCSACTKRVSLAEPDPEPLLWLFFVLLLGILTPFAQMDLAPWVLGVGR